MRLAKLSLAAIVALGVSAFADVQNVKFGGDAKLYYGTTDENPNDLFSKDNSYGQIAADLAVDADLADDVHGKLKVTAISTLGLENNLVNSTWTAPLNNIYGDPDAFDLPIGPRSGWWISEAWLAKSFGNTTVKIGRQELDTPLAFSEKWNIASNSFDAAVVLNNDLPQTTLVAAWVGRGNGAPGGAVVRGDLGLDADTFTKYGSTILYAYFPDQVGNNDYRNANSGAYALAAVTKLIPNTTAQVWYYDIVDIAQAWWLQADVDLKEVVPGLSFGVQYAYINPGDIVDNMAGTDLDESKAWAVKIGYAMDALKLSAAYSSTDEDGVVVIANTATGAYVGSQSKLYTEAWWNYGYVGVNDVDAWMLSAEYKMEGVADFYAQYTAADAGKKALWAEDMTEFTLTASKSFGSLDTTLAYIYTDADDQNFDKNGKPDSYNTIQVYLTYNF